VNMPVLPLEKNGEETLKQNLAIMLLKQKNTEVNNVNKMEDMIGKKLKIE